MAEHHRLPHAHRAEAAMQVVVQVRAADAAGADAHARRRVGPSSGAVDLLDAQILFGMDDDGERMAASLCLLDRLELSSARSAEGCVSKDAPEHAGTILTSGGSRPMTDKTTAS